MARHTKVARAFSEVKRNEPAIVGKTRRKKGAAAARRQKIAIALSKARRKGAKIPMPIHTPEERLKRSTRGSPAMTKKEMAQGFRVLERPTQERQAKDPSDRFTTGKARKERKRGN